MLARPMLPATESTLETLSGEVLWGTKAIARFLDVSEDKVRALRDAGAPIGRVGGHVCSFRTDLMQWLRDQVTRNNP